MKIIFEVILAGFLILFVYATCGLLAYGLCNIILNF